jgi:LmbE family N-acetylglucosaminyl deacetylase
MYAFRTGRSLRRAPAGTNRRQPAKAAIIGRVMMGDSIVVVSPHSDDGVLSLAASMARWARAGMAVELLTVLALNPSSEAPTQGWDRRAGFATEGEAARARREEDRAACAVLGATPRWLPFGSVDYERHGDDAAVWEAVNEVVDGAGAVLAPGSPLSHPDHAWLHGLLASKLPARALALYAEQPYTLRESAAPFAKAPVTARDRLAKWRAIRAYRSQLPLLGMQRSVRRGALRLAWADERIDWPDGSPV